MDNRFVATVAASSSQFNVSQDTLFSSDYVDLDPDRGLYGPRSDEKIYTHLNTASLSFEDRLKLTSTFALIGSIRFEDIKLDRTRFDPTGVLESAKGYPFSTTFNPVVRIRRRPPDWRMRANTARAMMAFGVFGEGQAAC
jgi:iron complex outermembrane recepter protein